MQFPLFALHRKTRRASRSSRRSDYLRLSQQGCRLGLRPERGRSDVSIEALNWALSAPLGGTTKIILLGLANHAGADFGDARPSVATLARYAHCDPRTVQRHLRNLEADGWITREGAHALNGRADRAVTVWRLTGRQIAAPSCNGVTSERNGVTSEAERGDIAMSPEPPMNHPEPSLPVAGASDDDSRTIYTTWLSATDRNPSRTQLTPERRRCIAKAHKRHGLAECLAAVTNIGACKEARNGYGRGTRFDDIKHALGSAERVEKWRDWKPPATTGNGKAGPQLAYAGNLDRFNDSEV